MRALPSWIVTWGWILGVVAPVEFIAWTAFGPGYEGTLHLPLAGIEAVALAWAAMAPNALTAARLPAGLAMIVFVGLLAIGWHFRLTWPSSLASSDPSGTSALVGGAILVTAVAALSGVAARAAVRLPAGIGPALAGAAMLVPIASDLWGSLSLLDDPAQYGPGVVVATLVGVASGVWLVGAVSTMHEEFHRMPAAVESRPDHALPAGPG